MVGTVKGYRLLRLTVATIKGCYGQVFKSSSTSLGMSHYLLNVARKFGIGPPLSH